MNNHNFSPGFNEITARSRASMNTGTRQSSGVFGETAIVNRGLNNVELRNGDLIGIFYNGQEVNIGSVTSYKAAVAAGYNGTEADWAQDMLAALRAVTAADSAIVNGLKAEGWAVGTQNGIAVGETSPYFENNAKYFYEEASRIYVLITTVAQSIPEDYMTLDSKVQALGANYDACVNGGFVENEVAYFTHDGEVLFEITGIGGGGGGGGGGGNNAVMTLESTTGWNAKTFAPSSTVTLTFTWSSIEDELPTGDGTLRILVNGMSKAVRNIAQGNISLDVSSYLSPGSNSVKLSVTDSYGNNRIKNFTITIVAISIASSFDPTIIQNDAISFPYTPYGEIAKTVYFKIDGTTIATVSTSATGRQLNQAIPAQTHGAHTLEVYFESVIDEETLTSNVLYYDVIWVESGVTTPIISCAFHEDEVSQYRTVNIPYQVYTPTAQVSEVTIAINGTTAQVVSVDRTQQMFAWRMDTIGDQTITISSGGVTKTIEFEVIETPIDVEPETENLALYLTSSGRSNYEEHPDTWVYNNIEANFNNFNWISDGWQIDDDGITALRVSGDARVEIPYKPFATDFRNTGKTIEIEFATRDVLNYDAVILSCMNGGRGISMTAQSCLLASEQSRMSMQFKEDEHVRVGFVVEKRSAYHRIYCYINGIMSGVVQYPDDDDFQQATPVNITIGNNDCTTDIYCIRIYDNDLTNKQMEDNWIADTQDGGLMLERYLRNDVRDAYGSIVIAKLPADLPYMIIEGDELPQYKGDKKTVSGSYTDPNDTSKSFTFTNCQIDVQGTSSQYYERKNYKMKFNGGFTNSAGQTNSKYQMRSDSIATKTFCMKADVASSEGANNVELVRLYNEICPYQTPAQEENPLVRQGIDGFPIVIFWHDTANDVTVFLGKYNFNNDKSTEDVFGLVEGDESWEIKNNTSSRVIWKNDDYRGQAWLNDFEARYPDTDPAYTDSTQLAAFASWVRSTDPEQATGDALPQSVVYVTDVVTTESHTDPSTGEITYEEVHTPTNVTYTEDTAAYRKAKFRAELENYVELNSTLFYYLFTEAFLMVDSRAKNAFPSFIGEAVVGGGAS